MMIMGLLNIGAVSARAEELTPLPQGPAPLLIKQSAVQVAPGVRHLQYQGVLPDGKPLAINVLEADLKNKEVEVRPELAIEGQYGKRESVSSIAARTGGVAAVNGAFYSTVAPYQPIGNVVIDHEVVAASDTWRTSIGWMDDKSVKFGYFNPELFMTLDSGQKLLLERLNRTASGKGISLYTSAWGSSAVSGKESEILITLIPVGGTKYQVDMRSVGTAMIPPGGLVLSIPQGVTGFQELQPGVTVNLEQQWDTYWDNLKHLLTSGPLLVDDHRPVFQSIQEGFTGSLLARNPRTALGVTDDQLLLLVTVDGRQPEKSVGVTFEELSYLMVELGSQEALGLDGGGSTTSWVNGKVVNQLSDGYQRVVANTIIIKSGIVVYIDGKRVYFDVPPQIEGGRTLVPLRAIFEALGCKVNWDSKTKNITATKGETKISLTLGSKKANINGVETILDVPAKEMNGRTLVPIRFVSEFFGTSVNWDPQKIINIYSKKEGTK